MPNDFNPDSSLLLFTPNRAPGIISLKLSAVGSKKNAETETCPVKGRPREFTIPFWGKLTKAPLFRVMVPPLAALKFPETTLLIRAICKYSVEPAFTLRVLEPLKYPVFFTVTNAAFEFTMTSSKMNYPCSLVWVVWFPAETSALLTGDLF
jgi:hypothetical protein